MVVCLFEVWSLPWRISDSGGWCYFLVKGGWWVFCFFLSLAASRNGRLFIIRSVSCVFTYLCAYLVPSIPLVLNTLIYLLVNLHQDRVRAGEKIRLGIIWIHDLPLESTFQPKKKNPHFFLPIHSTPKAANCNQYVHWLGGVVPKIRRR